MVVILQATEILEKQQLLFKSSKTGLTEEERKRLEEIEFMLSKAHKELIELARLGAEIQSAKPDESIILEQKEQAKAEKQAIKAQKAQELGGSPKLTIEERRKLADKLIAEERLLKTPDKELIEKVSQKMGVSNTYIYRIVKEK